MATGNASPLTSLCMATAEPADRARPKPDEHALFTRDGDVVVPTDLARGPWSPDALHGGPVAALIGGVAGRRLSTDGMLPVRLTAELVRPVPVAPLALTVREVRPGKRVRLLDVTVTVAANGTEVALGRVLGIREAHPDLAVEPTVPEDEAPPGPDAGATRPPLSDAYPAFHNGGIEIRFVRGRFDQPGPATVWFRLRGPVVAGEDPIPFERAAAAADFGNGVAAELEFRPGTIFINPDLTVSVHRPPEGEWVCLDARTRFGAPGIGTAESALWDERGRIGRAIQNLLVEPPG